MFFDLPALLHLILFFPEESPAIRRRPYLPVFLYIPAFIMSPISSATNFFFEGVREYPWGFYEGAPGPGLFVWALYFFVFVGYGVFYLFKLRIKASGIMLKQVNLFIAAILLPATASVATYMVPSGLGSYAIPPLTPYFISIGILLIDSAILKYQMLVIPPISRLYIPLPEESRSDKPKYKMQPGYSYAFEEKEPKRGVEMFLDAVFHGIPGIWITSSLPYKIERKYGLSRTPIVAMISERIRGEITVKPSDLGYAKSIVSHYLSRTRGHAAVLVDCFYELLVANGFKRALGFVGALRRKCVEKGASLIVTFDPEKLTRECVRELRSTLRGN